MKQLFLTGKGEITTEDVPLPGRLPKSLLVRNLYSLISTGTESSAVSKRGGWLGVLEKANNSRDKVAQVWKLARQRGFETAWESVQAKLNDHTAIGYSSCGQVVETNGTSDFHPGDLVACMGVGFATHAEFNVVPTNLAVKLPDGVSPQAASFAALACIAQQGIRNLELTPGENVVVIGLGLIGTIAATLAKAMGYTVFGIDLSPQRAEKCERDFEIPCWDLQENVQQAIARVTNGTGADGVLLTAATKRSEPVNLAFDLCRARGVVSVVGDVGLELQRPKMYRKEISLRVSCSYGPGRYDDEYELHGRDYPLAHARWTERRNLEFFLQLLANQSIDLQPLLSKTFSINEGAEAYRALKQADPNTYGVLFDYGAAAEVARPISRDAYTLRTGAGEKASGPGRFRIGVIGCGGFAKTVHLPNLRRLRDEVEMAGIASRSGATAAIAARRFGVPIATSDHRVLLDDPSINAVLVCTRHASHAPLVLEALAAGKHVFVEKPLCLTVEDGERIETLARQQGLVVRVGFNRRFAPYLQCMKTAIGATAGRMFTCRVNVAAGRGEHWSNTAEEGGRFLGEGVHFLDLCNWFVGSAPRSLSAHYVGRPSSTNPNLIATISYPDDSVCSVIYATIGDHGIGKEAYEAFGAGRTVRCDDFHSLQIYGVQPRVKPGKRNDKGHSGALHEFVKAVRGETIGHHGADARAGTLATWMAGAVLASAHTRREIAWTPQSTDIFENAA